MENPNVHPDTHELPPVGPPEAPQASKDGDAPKARPLRGFAAMDRKLVSEIARKGGRAAHSAGTAHEFTTEEARAAGRKGGQAAHANRRRPAASTVEAPETHK